MSAVEFLPRLPPAGRMVHNPTTSQEVGFDSSLEFAAKSRNCTVSGFFIGTSYGGADGRAQALPVFAPRVPRPVNPSALPPDLTVGRQSFNGTLEAIMANALASSGANSAATSLSTFAPELTNIDGQITTTSLQVAQHFGKRHDTVLRAIRNLGCSAEFRLRNYAECSRPGSNNKPEPYFRLTRDGFTFLAMGFTGKEADQWKEAYIDAFNYMQDELTRIALPSATITPAQAQHLRELVQLVVESGKQGHGETWNRLHRKMKTNSYLELRPDQFDAACQYLRGKFDDTSLAAIAQKHFPQLALPAPEMKPIETTPLPFGVDALCAFIGSGLIDHAALLKIADASGMALYIGVTNEQDRGWGQAVADQIDDTLPQADLRAIVNKSVQTLWMRALKAAKHGRPLPQRSHFNA